MKKRESWLYELQCDHAAVESVCSFRTTLVWSGKALDDYQYVQEQDLLIAIPAVMWKRF